MRYANTAYVLGLCPNGLGVVRSLGRKGIPVIGLDYHYPMPGFFSRYCVPYPCPNPFRSPEELCGFLMGLTVNNPGKGVLFPTSDEFVLFVSRHREKLSERFLFALPDGDVVESLLNKRWQYAKAEETSTPYPSTRCPTSMDEVERLKHEIVYPVIIKPCYTHLWKEKSFGVKGYLVHDPRELVATFERIFPTGVEVIIQSVIPGDVTDLFEVCCYMNSTHEPLCVFIKRKMRQYPLDMGLGSLMKSVRDEHLARTAVHMFRGIGYRGIGEIEFKRDPRDGVFKMIEINSRVTLQNSLADYCGVNLPLIQYLDLLGQKVDVPAGYREDASWVWAEIDYEGFRELRRRGDITVAGWLGSVLASDCHAVFAWDDLGPTLSFVKGFLARRLSRFTAQEGKP